MTTFIAKLNASHMRAPNSFHQANIRVGAFAGLMYAAVGALANIILPYVAKSQPHPSSSSLAPPLVSARVTSVFSSLTLEKTWSISYLAYAFLMFGTTFTFSSSSAIVLIALTGIPWALAQWIPFALLGAEIARLRTAKSQEALVTDENLLESQDDAGITLGLHNAAISAPQILAALVCGLVVWLADVLGSRDGVGWAMRFGGCAALYTAWLARDLTLEV
ncbi:MAG: hypothetical protein M1819_003480 [Sarea resinae]|nr:MAG: hypothetical protein M1819_003480 [Sarea resinae]